MDNQGRLLSREFYSPAPDLIIKRLRQKDTERYYSSLYRNPNIYYTTEDGCRYRLWYEDERSVTDKIQLAKMFGVTGVSLWRLGTIPDFSDSGLHYNVWNSLLTLRE